MKAIFTTFLISILSFSSVQFANAGEQPLKVLFLNDSSSTQLDLSSNANLRVSDNSFDGDLISTNNKPANKKKLTIQHLKDLKTLLVRLPLSEFGRVSYKSGSRALMVEFHREW